MQAIIKVIDKHGGIEAYSRAKLIPLSTTAPYDRPAKVQLLGDYAAVGTVTTIGGFNPKTIKVYALLKGLCNGESFDQISYGIVGCIMDLVENGNLMPSSTDGLMYYADEVQKFHDAELPKA